MEGEFEYEELHPGFVSSIPPPHVMMNGSVIVSTKGCSSASTIPSLQENMEVSSPSPSPTPGNSHHHQQQQQEYDVTRMREEDFERLAVYIVPDVPCERGVANRAEKTLPRSLTLKPSLVLSTPNVPTEGVWSTGVIPRGTRFGPFEGIPTPNFPSDKSSWRYFWREELHPGFVSSIPPPHVMMNGSVIVSTKGCSSASTIPSLQENMEVSSPSPSPTPGNSHHHQQQQQEYDVTRMREEDFERLAVYIVPDVPCERGVANRAEKTLPRSLTLKPSLVLSTPNVPTEGVWSTGVIPRGTRFGPFEGIPTPNFPSDKSSWRYFWRVQGTRHVTYGNIKIFKDADFYYLDGSDTSHANWMRYVASAYSLTVMNLVACQHQEHIYFYTIRDIMPNEELMVWYCRDFAKRLGYDVDPERATYSIAKEETMKKAYGVQATPVHPEVAYNHMKFVMGFHIPRRTPTPSPSPPPPTPSETGPPNKGAREANVALGRDQSPLREGCKEKDAESPVSQVGKDTTYEHQLTPTDGSVRSDEGYHSNGYHDDGFTPPEDSSDSESENNYTIAPKETTVITLKSDVADKNEYRKVKMKMPLKYEFKNSKGIKVPPNTEVDKETAQPKETAPEKAGGSPKRVVTPATSTVIVLDSSPHAVVPLMKPFYEAETTSPPPPATYLRYTPPSSSILETILTGNRPDESVRRQPNATPPPTSPTEMAYSYKKSQRYGNACSPDSSSNLQSPIAVTQITSAAQAPRFTTVAQKEPSPQLSTLIYSTGQIPMTTNESSRSPTYTYGIYSGTGSNVITHTPTSPYSPHEGQYERLAGSHSLTSSPGLITLQNGNQIQLSHHLMTPLTPLQQLSPHRLHKRLHTNDRPYVCQGCDKKYISASGLRTHWKTTSCKPNNIEEELALAAAATSECFAGGSEKDHGEVVQHDMYEMHHLSSHTHLRHIGQPPPTLISIASSPHQQNPMQTPSMAQMRTHVVPTSISQGSTGPPGQKIVTMSKDGVTPVQNAHQTTQGGHYSHAQNGDSRPSVIESSQPLIIECT
uniref:SET domain-containing protein n=2 Tax=Lutzomyia longipalpis TaxID=7200 RepID=A0A1B0CIK6_LUTLO